MTTDQQASSSAAAVREQGLYADSGWQRGEDGKWGLLRYTQIKTAYHHYG